MRKALCIWLVFPWAVGLAANAFGDGTFVPKYEEQEYEGSLEQTAQEGIIVYKDGVEDLVLKITYQGKPQDFAWVIPFPSVPEISKESAELFAELFAYVEHAIAKESGEKAFGCGMKSEEEEGRVEVIARKIVGSYETTTVKEKTKGALNLWLKENGYIELKGAEKELEHYRKLGWVFVAVKVRDAVAAGEQSVDLHPLSFKFATEKQGEMVYPLKVSVFQKAPLDVNLYVFADSMINIDYDENGVLTKGFLPRYREGRSRRWSHRHVEGVSPMLTTRRFFLRNYPHERFFLTNIQARGLKPADIRDWSEDLYIYPQYVYLLHPSTWYWPQWLGLVGGGVVVLIVIRILLRLHQRKKAASA